MCGALVKNLSLFRVAGEAELFFSLFHQQFFRSLRVMGAVAGQAAYFAAVMLAAMPEHSPLLPGVTAQTSFVYCCRGQFWRIDYVLRFPRFQVLGGVSVTGLAISSPCPREKSGSSTVNVLSEVLYCFFVTLGALFPGGLIVGRFALGLCLDRLRNRLPGIGDGQAKNEC
jgi:hypothetical protein